MSSTRRRAVVAGVGLVLVFVSLQLVNRWHGRSQDRTVCEQMQRLDGQRDRPEVLAAIRDAGMRTDDRLGRIAGNADSSGTGSLDLVSEDYDYVIIRCSDIGRPAPNVDPAHRG